MPPDKDKIKEGLVSACYGRELSVFYGDRLVKATVKGRLLEENSRHNIVSGDICILEVCKNRFMVTGIKDRKSELIRFLEKRDRRVKNQVIAANCDQLIAVFSFTEPNINPLYLDLVLCHANYSGIFPVIVFNKIDIADQANFRDITESYHSAGFDIILTSVSSGINIEKVKNLLRGRKSVLAGPSGSGKSSLLKAVNPAIDLRIGSLTKYRKGSHTTSTAVMYRLFEDTFIYDTPGFGKMSHSNIDYEIIKSGYPEFHDNEVYCEYGDCRHIEEQNCHIKSELVEGKLSPDRYRRYYLLAKNLDPVSCETRETMPADTGLFIANKTVFRIFDIQQALRFRDLAENFPETGWFHYGPFIYFMGQGRHRKVLIKEINGQKQVFLWKMKNNSEEISLLFLNPFTTRTDLTFLLDLLKDINTGEKASILFLSESDLSKLSEYEGIEIESAGREYIFRRQDVIDMKGRCFKDLRKKISSFLKNYPGIVLRGYKTGDSTLLKDLYQRWLSDQSIKYPNLYDSYYTENALNRIDDLSRLDVDIMIAEHESGIAGFIMGGRINTTCACAFIMKTDNRIQGLSYYLKYRFIESCKAECVNDGIDFGFPGLKQSKRKFNPVEFPKVYRGRLR